MALLELLRGAVSSMGVKSLVLRRQKLDDMSIRVLVDNLLGGNDEGGSLVQLDLVSDRIESPTQTHHCTEPPLLCVPSELVLKAHNDISDKGARLLAKALARQAAQSVCCSNCHTPPAQLGADQCSKCGQVNGWETNMLTKQSSTSNIAKYRLGQHVETPFRGE
jgi:hypothetical protein